MFKKIIAPTLAIAFAITSLTILGINLKSLANSHIEDQDYFIKFNPQANMAIVEPNYGYFFHPDPDIQGNESGQELYQALSEINQRYGVEKAKMVRFERKGYVIPNLYVFLKSSEPKVTMTDNQIVEPS